MQRQTAISEIEGSLDIVLNSSCPPVARCRLLSSGFAPHHTLDITEDITGSVACLGCGNCIDICPVLSREPARMEKTEQRSSMALESLVSEDCDRCFNCVLVCPQVDTTIKHYIVNRRMIEVMSRLEMRIGDENELDLDLYVEEALA
ncbi:MAG: 4Fe-4S dicluster domain-containing protein [Chloroflexota bacterium]|nr:4Fe-4S dicluster domain-containing protein [Chloroflexota bacterium]